VIVTVEEGRVTLDGEVDWQYQRDAAARAVSGLTGVVRVTNDADTGNLKIGLFGASTGAGAALMAAATRPNDVGAVVSRGGRPDLAGPFLALVTAPTLLIVGSLDVPVIGMNRDAMAHMRGEVKLEIVTGATHLFEEPGTLARVADLAADWFTHYLRVAPWR
jgi:putative phosphoribosyl transferase